MSDQNPPRRLSAEERLARDQVLLDILKRELPRLEDLLARMRDWYIDRMYRFYYQSFKVYDMQGFTAEAVELLRSIGNEVGQPLAERFETIVADGTGKTFEFEHNRDWLRHTRPIVEACKEAGAYVVTQWNKPADLHPWDFDPNYVAHISFSGVPYGKAMAETLFKAMGGKGGIVALGGIQSNIPAIERKAGLDEALAANPDIKLLDFQVANWSDTEALEKTNAWLTQFGDEIGGIWAANDGMGLAAVEALRADGRAGKVPVTGIDGIQLAVEAVMAGEFAGTVAWDPFWQGGMGLSIPYHAKTGKFDPAAEPREHREFYGSGIVITAENAQEFYKNNIEATPELDWNDIWGRVSGQIQYQ